MLKIIGRIAHLAVPLAAEPAHIALDRFDVLLLFLLRIRVVKTQVAGAAIFFRQAEVQKDRLRVADVQIAVWLRRKTGDDLRLAIFDIFINDRFDKVRGNKLVLVTHKAPPLSYFIISSYYNPEARTPSTPARSWQEQKKRTAILSDHSPSFYLRICRRAGISGAGRSPVVRALASGSALKRLVVALAFPALERLALVAQRGA